MKIAYFIIHWSFGIYELIKILYRNTESFIDVFGAYDDLLRTSYSKSRVYLTILDVSFPTWLFKV
jgi:hypothetical protein